MKKSNIFAYVELAKLAQSLQQPATTLKEELKVQSAYFTIIPAKYFSDALVGEWEAILQRVHLLQPEYSTSGRSTGSRVTASRPAMNTAALAIEQMSEAECQKLARQIQALFQKLEKEFL